MRILVVEDEVQIREGLSSLIKMSTGHVIVGEAADGREGVKKCLRLNPDLVITDIRMPMMSGLEMTKILKDSGYNGHIVIISGYSEFEYARQAITYGVDDYLLKPLTADKVEEMLTRVENKINEEWKMVLGEPSWYFLEMLNDADAASRHIEYLKQMHPENTNYMLLAGYIGSAAQNYKETLESVIEEIDNGMEEINIYGCYQGNLQIYYCMIFYQDSLALYQCMDTIYQTLICPYDGQIKNPLWAWERVKRLEELYDVGEEIRGYLMMGLSEPGYAGWYSANWAAGQKWEEYQEPAECFQKLKSGLYKGKQEEIQTVGEALITYYKKHHFHSVDIQQGIIKIYYLIMDVLRDTNSDVRQKLRTAGTLRQFNDARSWNELEIAYIEMLKILGELQQEKREDIGNYNIRRAISYIEKHYHEKITQEDVASYLEITPEYLSTLFSRVMKENFSSYMKRIRINQAKILLSETSLKIYEVAEQVGYSDAKYFNRVFKEEVGISPGEYRQ